MTVLVQDSLLDDLFDPLPSGAHSDGARQSDAGPGLGGDHDHRLGPLGAARRTDLGQGAWIDVLPGWVSSPGEVFDALVAEVPWHGEQRRMYERVVEVPRLLSWYGEDAELPHPVLTAAKAALSRHYQPELGESFVTAGLCLYRDGKDSVAWHGDTIGRGRTHDTMVAIVSLGTPRSLLLRPRGGRLAHRLALGHGDLVVMGGSCQRTWEHAIPKTARAVGPRISVQFRTRGVR
jgi:alkylated DNA repair dioxygenase AlkB